MKFSDIAGSPELTGALKSMVSTGRIPHAILLHEDDGGDGFRVAVAFLQYVFCRNRSDDSCGDCPSCNKVSKLIHPDVHFVFPTTAKETSLTYLKQFRELAVSNPAFTEQELSDALGVDGKSSIIPVSEAKEMMETLNMSALEGGYRAMVIYLPELMQPAAANKILKLLEEPPSMTIFILITHSPEKVLRTIQSRCQRFRVMPSDSALRKREGEMDETFRDLFSSLMEALVSHDLLAAIEVGEQVAALPDKENAKAFCKFAADSFRTMFLLQQGMESLTEASEDMVRWSGKVKKTFPRKASDAIDRASMFLSRNVNVKIVFTDLSNRLSLIV